MTKIAEIMDWMQQVAPLELSEDWDNTGLLLGCRHAPVGKIQTCLTMTPATVQEAIESEANLIISHHPLPFRPLARITSDTLPGKMLWDLASHGIALYSPHTAWDSARLGINALLAEALELQNCQAIVPSLNPQCEGLGAGRIGELPKPARLEEIVQRLNAKIPHCRPRGVNLHKPLSRVAIACGSGGSLLPDAIRAECDLFLTGEATFHTCLESEAAEVTFLMLGHYASERFAMDHLAQELGRAFADIHTWASKRESDPVQTIL
ncbi:MAG: Nif3-like dinuclear metal center hexameric protein [bacterium]|nr:Nif3-like dinuclear metal center hexameric protein [bacterium]